MNRLKLLAAVTLALVVAPRGLHAQDAPDDYQRGVQALADGDPQAAHAALTRAIARAPGDARGYFARGLASRRLGDQVAAREDFAQGASVEAQRGAGADLGTLLSGADGAARAEVAAARRAAAATDPATRKWAFRRRYYALPEAPAAEVDPASQRRAYRLPLEALATAESLDELETLIATAATAPVNPFRDDPVGDAPAESLADGPAASADGSPAGVAESAGPEAPKGLTGKQLTGVLFRSLGRVVRGPLALVADKLPPLPVPGGSPAGADAGDPFGDPADDPFGGAAEDPFAGAPAADDPAAEDQAGPEPVDPLAGGDDPFADAGEAPAAEASEDPFGAALDDPQGDPFGDAPGDDAGGDDLFGDP